MSKKCNLQSLNVNCGGEVFANFQECKTRKSYQVDITDILNYFSINLANVSLIGFKKYVQNITFKIKKRSKNNSYYLDVESTNDFVDYITKYNKISDSSIKMENWKFKNQFEEDLIHYFA